MDLRQRCAKGHLVCEDCIRCACDPDVSGRVSTDRGQTPRRDTLCPDCRYDREVPV